MTTGPFRARTKTVTRRFGRWFLKPGDVVCGVAQSRGLKKGEKIKRLGLCAWGWSGRPSQPRTIVSTRAEPLNAITAAELVLEGLAGSGVGLAGRTNPKPTSPRAFVDRLCVRCRVPPHEPVNRIAFEYLD